MNLGKTYAKLRIFCKSGPSSTSNNNNNNNICIAPLIFLYIPRLCGWYLYDVDS